MNDTNNGSVLEDSPIPLSGTSSSEGRPLSTTWTRLNSVMVAGTTLSEAESEDRSRSEISVSNGDNLLAPGADKPFRNDSQPR